MENKYGMVFCSILSPRTKKSDMKRGSDAMYKALSPPISTCYTFRVACKLHNCFVFDWEFERLVDWHNNAMCEKALLPCWEKWPIFSSPLLHFYSKGLWYPMPVRSGSAIIFLISCLHWIGNSIQVRSHVLNPSP